MGTNMAEHNTSYVLLMLRLMKVKGDYFIGQAETMIVLVAFLAYMLSDILVCKKESLEDNNFSPSPFKIFLVFQLINNAQ